MPWWLSRLFGWLRPSPPEPVPPVTPLRASPHPDATTLRISLYQTDALTDANGRHPEQTVARFAREALTLAGYNVDIAFNHPAVPKDGYATADTEALSGWAATRTDSAHANVLLHERAHNGIAYVGGRFAIAPGAEIDHAVDVTHEGYTDAHRNVRAALHELGHTLGGRHADGMIPAPHLTFQNTETGWMDSPPP